MCSSAVVRQKGDKPFGVPVPVGPPWPVSTWLNASVAAPQVAEWAGHSVQMLLSTYAKCIDGKEGQDRKRIDEALKWRESELDPED